MASNCELVREGTLADTGYVRLWHFADIDADDEHVCFLGKRTSLTRLTNVR